MCERVRMTPSEPRRRLRWWQRKWPSLLVFCLVLGAMVGITAILWSSVATVLPDVGKDKQGEDPWTDPVGVEKVGRFQVVHIPDCAAAPVVRIALWNEQSKAYWEIAGPATPMASFAIGATPNGWTVVTPYHAPPDKAVLRLAVVRRVKGVAGVRFKKSDLRTDYVASGQPISRYLVDDFQTGSVCGDQGKHSKGSTTSSTSITN